MAKFDTYKLSSPNRGSVVPAPPDPLFNENPPPMAVDFRNVPPSHDSPTADLTPHVQPSIPGIPNLTPQGNPARPTIITLGIEDSFPDPSFVTSDPIPTPTRLRNIQIWAAAAVQPSMIQIVTCQQPIADDATFILHPTVFTAAPQTANPLQPWYNPLGIGDASNYTLPIDYPLPQPPSNRVTVRYFGGAGLSSGFIYITLLFQPEE